MTIKSTIELEKIVNSELASKVDSSSTNYGELLIEIKVEELINVKTKADHTYSPYPSIKINCCIITYPVLYFLTLSVLYYISLKISKGKIEQMPQSLISVELA